MSIKWYRDSGRRVLTPRRDNPKAPPSFPGKKPKKGPRVKAPKVKKPRVRVPFIKSAARKMSNASVGGLNAVKIIAADAEFNIDRITWQYTGSEKTCRHLELPTKGEEFSGDVTPVCEYLSKKTWDNMEEFYSEAARQTHNSKRTDGIWALSHVNCECTLRIRMANAAGLVAHYIVSVRDENGLGYRFDPSGSTTVGLDGAIADPHEISGETKANIAKMNVEEDKEARTKLLALYDSFGNTLRSDVGVEPGLEELDGGDVDVEIALQEFEEAVNGDVEDAPEPGQEAAVPGIAPASNVAPVPEKPEGFI